MLIIHLFLCLSLAISCTTADLSDYKQNWLEFKSTYNKRYEDLAEEKVRFATFVDNQKKIFKHNRLYSLGRVTYKLKSNEFADLTHQEFVKNYIGSEKLNPPKVETVISTPQAVSLPPFIDWRLNGSVSEVQSQGSCRSSYAFAAAGVLEGQYQRQTGKLVEFSKQNLIDCSSGKFGNSGCNGGSVAASFNYILDKHGIDTELKYPYQASQGKCQLDVVQTNVSIKSIIQIKPGQEWFVQTAIATIGPIAVSFDASHESFQFYSSGIYYQFGCSKLAADANHSGLAVGYGTEKRLGYYNVKNSFGKSWGENGYVRMARFRANNCGIASNAIYTLL